MQNMTNTTTPNDFDPGLVVAFGIIILVGGAMCIMGMEMMLNTCGISFYKNSTCCKSSRSKEGDLENPQPQEDTNLLPAHDDEVEPKETCCGQLMRDVVGFFAKKPEFESVNDLPDTHPAHQI